MNDSLTQIVFLTQLVTTLFMVGVIWFVQIVDYPLLALIGLAEAPWYGQRHRILATRVMAVPMLIEWVTSFMLLIDRPAGIEDWMVWTGLGLLMVIAYFTVVTVRTCLRQLSQDFEPEVHQRLLRVNWIRVWCWSLRGALVVWMVTNSLQGSDGHHARSSGSSGLKIGDVAPDFTATTFDGKQVSLSDYRGKRGVVLFFYPKDGTSVCTKEACAFRDSYEKFVEAGAEVIGVSGDSDHSHQQFSSQHKLTFPLISDADGLLRQKYGVPNILWLVPRRVTFVIDKEGKVRMMFSALIASDEHVQKALQAMTGNQ